MKQNPACFPKLLQGGVIVGKIIVVIKKMWENTLKERSEEYYLKPTHFI